MEMNMPKPGEPHRKLARLVGIWTGEDRMHPSPWCAEGATAGARLTCSLALGGFAVVSDYEQQRDGRVTFSGHGIHRWDAHHQRYMLHWFDSMGLEPSIFTGDFEFDVAVELVEARVASHFRCMWPQEPGQGLLQIGVLAVHFSSSQWSTDSPCPARCFRSLRRASCTIL